MTIEDTAQVMDILTTAYPGFYAGRNAPDPEKALMLWASMFAEDDPAIVIAAVKALIAGDEKGFPPHIGAVKARIRQITCPVEMTEAEAWALISRAVKNANYGSREEFERLPPVLQRLVGSPNQLKEWAMLGTDTLQTVVASNFQRSYRTTAKIHREYDALPSDAKALAGQVSGVMALEEDT